MKTKRFGTVPLILMDTGPLLSMYGYKDEEKDGVRTIFQACFESGSPSKMVIPFPVLYETLSTQLVKFRSSISSMRYDWERLSMGNQIIEVSDTNYRMEQFMACFEETNKEVGHYHGLSLVDRILTAMLLDKRLKITHLFSFNTRDFAHLCEETGIEMISKSYL